MSENTKEKVISQENKLEKEMEKFRKTIKAWNRTWIMLAFIILSLFIGSLIFNLKGAEIVYNIKMNRPDNALRFGSIVMLIFEINILVTISYFVTNFKKGMTKNIYLGYIYFYILFIISNYIIFRLPVLWLSLIMLFVNVLVLSYITGKLIKRYLIGAICIIPSILVNIYLIYIFTYAVRLINF